MTRRKFYSSTAFLVYMFATFRMIMAQTTDESALFPSIVESVAWAGNLGTFKVEIDIASVAAANYSTNTSHYIEGHRKISILMDKSRDRLSMTSSVGFSNFSLQAVSGNSENLKEEHEEVSDTTVYLRESKLLKIFDEHKRFHRAEKISKADFESVFRVLGQEFQISTILYTFPNESGDPCIFVSVGDYLIDCKVPRDVVDVSSETTKTGKEVVVYRVTGIGDVYTPAYKFIISASGFDKGRIIEFQESFLKDADRASKYVSDGQLSPMQTKRNTIEWKEFKNPREADFVLPVIVRKSGSFRQSGKDDDTITLRFDWSDFEGPEDSEFEPEFAFEKAKEHRKAIDKALRR